MQSEKRKRSLTLLDDGELPDHHVDPHLATVVLQGNARKAKRDPLEIRRPSLVPSFIALGVVIITYGVPYFLGDVHLEHPDLVGWIPIGWTIAAFFVMAGAFGGHLLSLHEFWDLTDPPGFMVHMRHVAIIAIGFVVFVAIWACVLFCAMMMMAFSLNGGVGE